jgi:hypothetical protein
MTREDFIKTVRVPMPGVLKGIKLNYSPLQESVIKSFDKGENFILISPRQSGRSTSIILNLIYDLFSNTCWNDTIVISRTMHDNMMILLKIKEIIQLNSFINNITIKRNMITNGRQKIHFKTANAVDKMTSDERLGKRLVVSDAAFIPDGNPYISMLEGWDAIIMETVAGPTNKFNSIFLKNLIDFKGVGMFNIIKYTWKKLGFSKKWFDTQKKLFGKNKNIFKREILLKWV